MCLIIASQNGVLPSADIIKRAAQDNPHGWGLMYATKRGIQVHKGMRNSALKPILERAKGLPYVLHFRWATHGPKTVDNCHPFKVNRDLWMAHNGIIQIDTTSVPLRSDSWHFARTLGDLLREEPDWLKDQKVFIRDIEDFIGKSNKIAFLRPSGELFIANEQAGTREGDIWYSNSYSLWDSDDWEYRWTSAKSYAKKTVAAMRFDAPQDNEDNDDYTRRTWRDWHTCDNCQDVDGKVRWYTSHSQYLCELCESFMTERYQ